MSETKYLILLLWQLPQAILAFFLCCYFYITARQIDTTDIGDVEFWLIDRMKGAFSLGPVVFMHDVFYNDEKSLKHEYGHSIQSCILGPLYLLVIGIPSLLWAAYYTAFRPKGGYYRFYTERWANKLGGVE